MDVVSGGRRDAMPSVVLGNGHYQREGRVADARPEVVLLATRHPFLWI